MSLDFTQIFSEILWNGSESECTIIFKYFSSKRSLHRFAFVKKIFFAIERRERVIESKNVCLSPKKYGNSFTIELSLDKKAIFYFFKLLQV